MRQQYLADELSLLLGRLHATSTEPKHGGSLRSAALRCAALRGRYHADMPKTRSGKIMRRVIAGISNFTDVDDTTAPANPEIIDDIRHHVHGEKVASGDVLAS